MRNQDPFAPLSKKRKVGYSMAAAFVLILAAILLSSMEGGFTAWELLRTACLVSIPALAVLAMVVWLSAGMKSESGVGPANVKAPVRMLKVLPYLVGIIALFYLLKATEVFQSR